MKRLFKTKPFRVLAAAASVGVIAGFVYAAWTTNGGGSAYTKAGTASALSTVDVSASTTASLYPGVSGDVLIKVSNPNPYAVRVTTVNLNGTNADIAADASHVSAGCTTSGVSFTNQSGLSIDVPAKSGSTNGETQATLSGAASMSNASVNACQGATFTIPVSLSGSSN